MPIFINKNNIYLIQNNTKQSFYCKYLYVQTILYLLQNNTKQKIIGFPYNWFLKAYIAMN